MSGAMIKRSHYKLITLDVTQTWKKWYCFDEEDVKCSKFPSQKKKKEEKEEEEEQEKEEQEEKKRKKRKISPNLIELGERKERF